jgi:Sialic acid synthase
VINTLKKKFKCLVGYSDHSPGLIAPIASVAIGSKVIEKHYTISKKMKGPDHLSSLDPKELKEVISSIRNLEKSFGNHIKKPTKSENQNRLLARKSIVAYKNIKVGEKYSTKNITLKRPGSGISPTRFFDFIGKKSNKNYTKDELIKI